MQTPTAPTENNCILLIDDDSAIHEGAGRFGSGHPRELDASDETFPLDSAEAGEAATTAGSEKVVLLVDDDDDIRELAREILQEDGYRVLEAADGHQAIEAWRGFPKRIDLLLTDMVMPGGLSGGDVAECFKLDRPDSKILYSSGYNVDIFGPDITLREGFNYLPKPYFAKQLLDAVARSIDGGEAAEV